MQDFLDFFGHGFCHQIHERTLEIGGVYFSVCARDTGIYLGLVITVVLICFLHSSRFSHRFNPSLSRHSGHAGHSDRSDRCLDSHAVQANQSPISLPSGLPPLPVIFLAIILVIPAAFDGISSYIHLRETNNLIRFFTGYAAGAGVGLVASCAVLGMLKNSRDDVRVLDKAQPALITIVASALASVAFWLLYPYLGLVSPLLVLLAFLAIIVTLNALILSMTKRFCLPFVPDDQGAKKRPISARAKSRSRWATVLLLAGCLSLAEIALMGFARDMIFAVLFGGTVSSFQELFDLLLF